VSEGSVQIQQAAVAAQRGEFAQALATELGARLGRTLALTGGAFQSVGVLELADDDEPIVHQALRYVGFEGGAHVVLQQRIAALLAALEQGASADALEAAASAALDDAGTTAVGQVMESVADVMRRSFEAAGLPALAVEVPRVVQMPRSEPTWIEDTFFVRMRFDIVIEGFEAGVFDVLLPKADLAGDSAGGSAIYFLTSGDADRKRVAEIESALGSSAATLEPRELAKPLDERLLEAAAIVIPWDLAGRSGLELAESLARDPRLAHIAILVGARRPTRAHVHAALRAGARAVIPDPFDPEAIRAALKAAGGEAS
jgi:CheY-like chemotaxis protein